MAQEARSPRLERTASTEGEHSPTRPTPWRMRAHSAARSSSSAPRASAPWPRSGRRSAATCRWRARKASGTPVAAPGAATRRSVTPARAEATRQTRSVSRAAVTSAATSRMRAASLTLVPPNFMTRRGTDGGRLCMGTSANAESPASWWRGAESGSDDPTKPSPRRDGYRSWWWS